MVLPLDHYNLSKLDLKGERGKLKYKFPLYTNLLTDTLFTIWIMHYIATHNVSLYNYMGLLMSMSVMATSDINLAHELMHKPHFIDRLTAQLIMLRNFYPHFTIGI